jgi:hypothetical protein
MAHDADVARFIAAKTKSLEYLLSLPNVCGVGVGYRVRRGETTSDLAVSVHVRYKERVGERFSIPRSICGLRTDVVEAAPLTRFSTPAAWYDSVYHDSIVGGICCGTKEKTKEGYALGTLALVVQSTEDSDDAIGVSCRHVLDPDGTGKGTIVQPAEPFAKSRVIGEVGPFSKVKSDDLAGVTLTNTKYEYGVVAMQGSKTVKIQANPHAKDGSYTAKMDDVVTKIGAQGGVTKSIVTKVSYTGNGIGNGFLVATADPPFGGPGDSGALVMVGNYAAGILVGYIPDVKAAGCINMDYVNLRLRTKIVPGKEQRE